MVDAPQQADGAAGSRTRVGLCRPAARPPGSAPRGCRGGLGADLTAGHPGEGMWRAPQTHAGACGRDCHPHRQAPSPGLNTAPTPCFGAARLSVILAALSCSATKHSRSALLPGVTTAVNAGVPTAYCSWWEGGGRRWPIATLVVAFGAVDEPNRKEALSQTVKFERNCHLAEPPSDASPGGVIRTHRAIEADSEDAPIRPYNSEICMQKRKTKPDPVRRGHKDASQGVGVSEMHPW